MYHPVTAIHEKSHSSDDGEQCPKYADGVIYHPPGGIRLINQKYRKYDSDHCISQHLNDTVDVKQFLLEE
jgi:hypothetical protein